MSIFDEVHHQNLKLPTFDIKPPSTSNLSDSKLSDILIKREGNQKAWRKLFWIFLSWTSCVVLTCSHLQQQIETYRLVEP